MSKRLIVFIVTVSLLLVSVAGVGLTVSKYAMELEKEYSLNLEIRVPTPVSGSYTLATGAAFNSAVDAFLSAQEVPDSGFRISFESWNGCDAAADFTWSEGVHVGATDADQIRMFYAPLEGTAYVLSKGDARIKANADCSMMFAGAILEEDESTSPSMMQSVTALDFENFDTSNVVSGYAMFAFGSYELLNISGFSLGKLESASGMFALCEALGEIQLPSEMDLSSCTDLSMAFAGTAISSMDLSCVKNLNNVCAMEGMFVSCDQLKNVVLPTVGEGAPLETTSAMFSECAQLSTVDVSPLYFGNVKNLSEMFKDCTALQSVDFSGEDLSSVTNTLMMFSNCVTLASLHMGNEPIIALENADFMLEYCERLSDLTLPAITFAQGASAEGIFYCCELLTELDLSDWNTSGVEKMGFLFGGCSSLQHVDLSSFNTENVTDMSELFSNCSSLVEVDISTFSNASLEKLNHMFYYATELEVVYVGDGWDNTKILDNQFSTFVLCEKLVGGQGTTLDESRYYWEDGLIWSHADGDYAIVDGGAGAPGYFTHIDDKDRVNDRTMLPGIDFNMTAILSVGGTDIGAVTVENVVFRSWAQARTAIDENDLAWKNGIPVDADRAGLIRLFFSEDGKTAYVLSFRKDNILANANCAQMFAVWTKVKQFDFTNFNTVNTTNMAAMFGMCESLTEFDLSVLNTSNVTVISDDVEYGGQIWEDRGGLFAGCLSLQRVDMSGFDFTPITSVGGLFYECRSLTEIVWPEDMSTPNLVCMFGTFWNCSSLESIDLSGFTTSKVNDMQRLFENCGKLTVIDLSGFDNSGFVTAVIKGDRSEPEPIYSMFDKCVSLETVYVSDLWNPDILQSSFFTFYGCTSIVGGQGTVLNGELYDTWIAEDGELWYSSSRDDQYARVDGDDGMPGYFTHKTEPPVVFDRTLEDGPTFNSILLSNAPYATGVVFSNWNDAAFAVQDNGFKWVNGIPVDEGLQGRIRLFYGQDGVAYVLSYADDNILTGADCSNMFVNMTKVVAFDFSNFNTAAMTDMSNMFFNCTSVRELDLSTFNTSNLTRISGQFLLPGYTKYDYGGAFAFCMSLERVVLTNMQFDKVTSLNGLFLYCNKLTEIVWPEDVNTSNVQKMSMMFAGCMSMTSIDVSMLDTEKVYAAEYMFAQCISLTEIDLSAWNVPALWDISGMFSGGMDRAQEFGYYEMALKTIKFPSELYITDLFEAFCYCTNIEVLDLSAMKRVPGPLRFTFRNMTSLTTILVSRDWNRDNIWTDYIDGTDVLIPIEQLRAFEGCVSLVGGNGTAWQDIYGNGMGDDVTFAHVDTAGDPGYLTLVAEDPTLLSGAAFNAQAMSGGSFSHIVFDNWNNRSDELSAHNYTWNGSGYYFDSDRYGKIRGFYVDGTLYVLSEANTDMKTNVDSSVMFANMSDVESITFCNLDTSKTTNMTGIFANCSSLVELDLSSFNTSSLVSLVDLEQMISPFAFCSSLQRVDLSGFDFSKVTVMSGLFAYCTSLKEVVWPDVVDCRSAQDMSLMFLYCTSIPSIDLTNFKNVGQVRSMSMMFAYCTMAEEILFPTDLDTSSVTDISMMFSYCSKLKSLDVSAFDTQNVVTMQAMFAFATSLKRLDVSMFDFSNVYSLFMMFGGDDENPMSLEEIVLPSVRYTLQPPTGANEFSGMTEMFAYCTELKSLDLSCFDASAVKYMAGMFYHCEKLETLDLSGFVTRDVEEMNSMFAYCIALKSVDLSTMGTSKATDMMELFAGCTALETIDLSGSFSMNSVTTTIAMFQNCAALLSVDLSNQDTSNLVNMDDMFYGCTSLISLDLTGKFNVKSVKSIANMFRDCESLVELDLSTWVLRDDLGACPDLFRGMRSLETIYVGDGWTSPAGVTCSHKMFWGCVSLVGGNGTVYDGSIYEYDENGIVQSGEDGDLARVDGGADAPGYFTHINDKYSTRELQLIDAMSFNGAVQANGAPTGIVFSTWNNAREAVRANGFFWKDGVPVTANGSGLIRMFFADDGTVYVLGLKDEQIYAPANCAMMFAQMSMLETIDFSDFRTDYMEDMSMMFGMCVSLTEVDISGFNTNSLTTISQSFEWDGDLYQDAGGPFVYCLALKKADISSLQFENLTSIGGLFAFCSSLEEIVWPDVIDTSNVTSMRYIFWGCTSLTDADFAVLTRFNTESLKDMSYSFTNCTGITVLDLSSFSNENIEMMHTAFWGCVNMQTIYVGDGWSNEIATTSEGGATFYRCFALVGEQGTVYDDHWEEYYAPTVGDNETVSILNDDVVLARVDGGESAPGYFTHISKKPAE